WARTLLRQRLHQPLLQHHPRYERRDEKVLVKCVRTIAVDAEAVERRHFVSREIAVAATAGRKVVQLEADVGGDCLGLGEERRDAGVLFERRPVETTFDGELDCRIVRLKRLDTPVEL